MLPSTEKLSKRKKKLFEIQSNSVITYSIITYLIITNLIITNLIYILNKTSTKL